MNGRGSFFFLVPSVYQNTAPCDDVLKTSVGRLRCFAAMCLALLLQTIDVATGRRGGAFLSTTGSFTLSSAGDGQAGNDR